LTAIRDKLRARVATMNNDRERLLRIAHKTTYGTVVRLRAGLIHAFIHGGNPDPVFARALDEIESTLLDGMIVAHVQATARTYAMFRAVKGIQLDRTSFTGILEAMQEPAQLEPAQLADIRAKYAVKAAKSASDAIAAAQKLIGEKARTIAATGINTRDGISALREAIDAAGLPVQDPRLLETVYRMEFNTAYSDARMIANDHPAIQEILWGYEYVTVGDDRVRPTHAALDRTRYAKDDPEWIKIRPPIDWGCRCSWCEILVDDVKLATPKPAPDYVEYNGTKIRIEVAPEFER